MNTRDLIRALGGPTRVAEECGVARAVVTNWSMRDRIAADHHIAIWRLATVQGVKWKPPGADGLRLVRAPS